MQDFTIKQIKNFLKIKKSGKKTFWASDFDFNGGEIAALSSTFIRRTGKTKKEILRLSPFRTKDVEISEWELIDWSKERNSVRKWFENSLGSSIQEILETTKLLHELGF